MKIVYGIDFDETLFSAEVAAALAVQNSSVEPHATGAFEAALKEGVARRLDLRPGDFQLLGTFEMPLVVGYEIFIDNGEDHTFAHETLVTGIPDVPAKTEEATKKWKRCLERAVDRLYEQGERKPKPELKLLVWHPQ